MPSPDISHPSRHPSRFGALLRRWVARPRLIASAGLFVVVAGLLWAVLPWRWPTIFLVAWNLAIGVWLALALAMMRTSDAATALKRARRLDENAGTILVLSVLAGFASLVAVVGELAVVKELGGLARAGHIALSGVTVFTAWAFMQVMFAIHYAHMHAIALDEGRDGGFRIPGETAPDYWDFLYVSAVMGTSGQTADVEFTAKATRRTALAHCVLAFFFNATVLALTVNIAAGIVQ